MEWKDFDLTDKSTWPTELGLYRVLVKGDSELVDGHVIYSFDDYETWATLSHVDPEDGEEGLIRFDGVHDEDEHVIIAYCGPISIPKRT